MGRLPLRALPGPPPGPVSGLRRANPSGPAQAAADPDLGLRPLTARSVMLSVLLGTHPPLLPVRSLVRIGDIFGLNEGTTRVALSRLMADGDVVAEGARYRLSDRLMARQQRQDEGRNPATRPWRGGWEMALIDPAVAEPAQRTAVGAQLAALRLAEWRTGVWMRPANLRRDWPVALAAPAWCFEARAVPTDGDGRDLAARLWDLIGWAERAEVLLAAWASSDRPPRRFMLAAATVRHLQTDPLLPRVLLPAGWPGTRLRAAYADYEEELGELLRRQAAGDS
jgi:phenylacetic acid degradation operon negative regulatory protein